MTPENKPAQPDVTTEAPATDAGKLSTPLLDEAVERQARVEMATLDCQIKRFEFQQRRANVFAASGLYSIKGVEGNQALAMALVKIELGEAMGFAPAESLGGIHVINGAVAVAAAVRAARMQAAGWTWDIEWYGTDEDPKGCRLWLYHKGAPRWEPVPEAMSEDELTRLHRQGRLLVDDDGRPYRRQTSVAFLEADAKRMLTTIWDDVKKEKVRASILEKDNWKMSPKNMYFSRAVTNAQRWHAPGCLSVNILSLEEAVDLDEEPGRQELPRGTRLAQETTAQRRIRELTGETAEEHEARLNAQMASQASPQTDPSKAAPSTGPAPAPAATAAPARALPEAPPDGLEDLADFPDPFDMREPDWVKVKGRIFRFEGGNFRPYIAPDPAPAPAAARPQTSGPARPAPRGAFNRTR